jgi:hypothetical protein
MFSLHIPRKSEIFRIFEGTAPVVVAARALIQYTIASGIQHTSDILLSDPVVARLHLRSAVSFPKIGPRPYRRCIEMMTLTALLSEHSGCTCSMAHEFRLVAGITYSLWAWGWAGKRRSSTEARSRDHCV